MRIKKLTTLALFSVLSLAIYGVESLLPPLAPIPGIKLGLANIITLLVLHRYGAREALWVLIVRLLLSWLLFGQAVSLFYSLCGGLLGLAIQALIHRLLKGHFLTLVGAFGGMTHNIGQMLAALLLTRTPWILTYLSVLLPAGILTGLFTGLCAHFAGKYLSPILKDLQ